MKALGDALAALYSSPRCTSLQGRVRRFVNWPLVKERLESDGRRGRRSAIVLLGGPLEPSTTGYDVWLERKGRLRIDDGQTITVIEHDSTLRYHPDHGAIRSSSDHPVFVDLPELLWRPRKLISALDVTQVETDEFLGRSCWQISSGELIDSIGLPMHLGLGGDRVELSVDVETGVILRLSGMLNDGQILSETAWESFEANAVIDPSIFDDAIPDGVAERTVAELQLDFAPERGVDVTGVDPNDPEHMAVLMRRKFPHTDPLEHYFPTGAAPADEGQARSEIVRAFAAFSEKDGSRLPFVQAGDGLAEVLEVAGRRYPDVVAVMTARRIKFINDREAVVMASVDATDGRQLLEERVAHAVIDHGRWTVARSTFAELMRLAGVDTPPP